jgi:hypothetical protein
LPSEQALTPPLRVVILGAPATGKTWLASALRQHLPSDIACLESNTPRESDAVLLMGLDLAPPSPAHSAQDAQWRQRLSSAGIDFQVIYGLGEARLHQALHAVSRRLMTTHPALAARLLRQEPAVRWQGVCEACSDPVCEHRLFSRLLTTRPSNSLQ